MRLLEAFWTRFGVNEETLRSWPERRFKDYVTVLRAESAINAEQKPAGSGSGSGPSSAEMTEMAFKAMKADNVPVEAPPADSPWGPHPSAEVRAERAALFQ